MTDKEQLAIESATAVLALLKEVLTENPKFSNNYLGDVLMQIGLALIDQKEIYHV